MSSTTVKQGRLLAIDAAGVGVCALIALLWYLTTVSPLLEQRSVIGALHRDIADRQQKTEELTAAMASATRQLAAVRQELSISGVRLDPAAHINKRIAGLTEVFAACALHIDDVQTGQVCNGLQCDLVPITFVGRGDYPHCIRFLHGLSSRFPDMSVMRIEFTGSPARTVEPERFRFEMFWYAAPQSAVRGVAREEPTHRVFTDLVVSR